MMITLTGFMGGGKTTVGRLLADSLGCPFMDLDALGTAAWIRNLLITLAGFLILGLGLLGVSALYQ